MTAVSKQKHAQYINYEARHNVVSILNFPVTPAVILFTNLQFVLFPRLQNNWQNKLHYITVKFLVNSKTCLSVCISVGILRRVISQKLTDVSEIVTASFSRASRSFVEELQGTTPRKTAIRENLKPYVS